MEDCKLSVNVLDSSGDEHPPAMLSDLGDEADDCQGTKRPGIRALEFL